MPLAALAAPRNAQERSPAVAGYQEPVEAFTFSQCVNMGSILIHWPREYGGYQRQITEELFFYKAIKTVEIWALVRYNFEMFSKYNV